MIDSSESDRNDRNMWKVLSKVSAYIYHFYI